MLQADEEEPAPPGTSDYSPISPIDLRASPLETIAEAADVVEAGAETNAASSATLVTEVVVDAETSSSTDGVVPDTAES